MTYLTKRTIALFFTLAFVIAAFPVLVSAASPFKDVKTNHPAYSSIEWAYKEGVTKGYPNGTFEPDRTVTEAQFVNMLIRLDCSAADSSKASTASNYRYLQNKNMPVNGNNNGNARDLPITKGQVARIAAAFQGVDLSEQRAVQYMYINDLANGATGKNDYKDYGATLSMTRADAVVFLNRLSNTGNCEMVGLNNRATGSDDKTITLPPAFLGTGTGTVTFNPPAVSTQPPVVIQPTVPTVTNVAVDIDIEKQTLMANGIDSTFVTVSLQGCTSGTIDYADSLPFTVTSALGARIDSGQPTSNSKYNLVEAIANADMTEAKLAVAKKAAQDAGTTLNDLLAKQESLLSVARKRVEETEGFVIVAVARVTESKKVVDSAAAYLNDLLTKSLDLKTDFSLAAEESLVTDARNRLEAALRLAELADANLINARKTAEDATATLNNLLAQLPANDKALVLDAQNRLKEAELVVATAETQTKDARTYLAEARAEANNRPNSSSAISKTDGPDMIVEVTAPMSSSFRTDKLTFQLNHQANKDCYSKPITVNLDYAPQAELRLEVVPGTTAFNGTLPANGSTAQIKATIVSPGGQVITNYDGRVRFRSAQGIALSDEYAKFSNGIAWTTVTSPSTIYSIADEITAELEFVDPRYKDQISSLVNTAHRIKVLYEPALQADKSCTFAVPEIAFIIDSSGSMKRSDPGRARVTKSQEIMTALSIPKNIAAQFNSNGNLLHPVADTAPIVAPKLIDVGQSGGTNIASGLKIAFSTFTPGNAPKVAILLTDGKSNEKQTLDIIAEAKQKNIKIYTIGLGSKKQLNEALLQKIATDTGGHYYHAAESSQLGAVYQSILSAITCDIPAGPACALSSQVFASPTLETVGNEFFMNTYVNDNCGQITRVVLRFNSSEGNIDYELANRNQAQGYFALKKGTYEINNFHLLQEGVFLAYNAKGDLVGEKRVQMTRR